MQLGFTSWNFEEELANGSMSIFDVVDSAKDIGCNCIEFMGYHLPIGEDDKLAKIGRYINDKGMQTSAIDARNMRFGGKWFEIRQDICCMKTYIDAAEKLGCSNLVVFLGYFENEETRNSQIEKDIISLRELITYGQPKGVKIAIENHRVYLRQVDLEDEKEAYDIIRICDTLGKEKCCAAPDSDNFFRKIYSNLPEGKKQKTYDYFDMLMPYAGHIHIKLKGFDETGKHVEADYCRLAKIIKAHNYDGAISFEFMKPIKEDKKQVLATAITVLKKELGI